MALFRENLGKRRVEVNGRPIEADEMIDSSQLVGVTGKDPSRHSLVRSTRTGETEIIPQGTRIMLRDGDVFETYFRGTGG